MGLAVAMASGVSSVAAQVYPIWWNLFYNTSGVSSFQCQFFWQQTVSCTDNIYGANAYSVQVTCLGANWYFEQAALSIFPSLGFADVGGAYGTGPTYWSVELPNYVYNALLNFGSNPGYDCVQLGVTSSGATLVIYTKGAGGGLEQLYSYTYSMPTVPIVVAQCTGDGAGDYSFATFTQANFILTPIASALVNPWYIDSSINFHALTVDGMQNIVSITAESSNLQQQLVYSGPLYSTSFSSTPT